MAVNEAPLLVIQQFLGHSDPKTTMRYIRRAEELAAKAYQYNTLPLYISKDALDKGKRVATRVTEVDADHRREEIARMLAGAEITSEARAAAERLIRAAAG